MHPRPEPVTGFLNSLHLHTHLAYGSGKIRSNQVQVRTGIHGLDLDCKPYFKFLSLIFSQLDLICSIPVSLLFVHSLLCGSIMIILGLIDVMCVLCCRTCMRSCCLLLCLHLQCQVWEVDREWEGLFHRHLWVEWGCLLCHLMVCLQWVLATDTRTYCSS
jgi:hypothetical protein